MNKRQQKKANKRKYMPLMMRVQLRNGKKRNRQWDMFMFQRYSRIINFHITIVPNVIPLAYSNFVPPHIITMARLIDLQKRNHWDFLNMETIQKMSNAFAASECEKLLTGGHWNDSPSYHKKETRISPYHEPERGIGTPPIWNAP